MVDTHIQQLYGSEPTIYPGKGKQDDAVMAEAGVEQNTTDIFQQVTATDRVVNATPAHDGNQNQDSLTEPPKLSKSALKRIRRQEAWLEKKKDRRVREKQKKKEARLKKREEILKTQVETHIPKTEDDGNVDGHSFVVGQKRRAEENGSVEKVDGQSESTMEKKQKINPIKVPIGVIIDCGFDDCMTEKVPRQICSLLTCPVQLNNWNRRLFLFRAKSLGATPRTGNLRCKFSSL